MRGCDPNPPLVDGSRTEKFSYDCASGKIEKIKDRAEKPNTPLSSPDDRAK